jgi:hypothetical protein
MAKQPSGANKLVVGGGDCSHRRREGTICSTFKVPISRGTVAGLITKQVLLHIKAGSLQILAGLHFNVEY